MVKEIYFAGGDFWGVHYYFSLIKGVVSVVSGFANGKKEPSYREVLEGCGHVFCVKIQYNADIISLNELLSLFYKIISSKEYQKFDYRLLSPFRSGIYYIDNKDYPLIKDSLGQFQKSISKNMDMECLPIINFFDADICHQFFYKLFPNYSYDISKQNFYDARNYQPQKK